MNRFVKGMTYNFHRNLGKRDRVIRTVLALAAIASWYFGVLAGMIGIIVASFGLMIIGTALSARCTLTYLAKSNTMSEEEKTLLDSKQIKYEK